jgi:prevent-host-death family protein
MKFSETIKPISYIKSHASEILRNLKNNRNTIVITQNGEATAVLQDVQSYEEMQESVALLKILALSNKSRINGQYNPLDESFQNIRQKIKER